MGSVVSLSTVSSSQAIASEPARPLALRISSLVAALALGAALLALLARIDLQPVYSAPGGLDVALSDALLLAAAALALWLYRGRVTALLARGRLFWLSALLLCAFVFAACFYPLIWENGQGTGSKLVSAAKFTEYAAIALTAGLVLGDRRLRRIVFALLALWSSLAALIAILQFSGLGLLGAWPAGFRQPSLIGIHDYAAFAGAMLALGLVALVLGAGDVWDRRIAITAGVSGWLGLVLSGSVAGAAGLFLAACAIGLLGWRRQSLSGRRLLALAAVVLTACAGVFVLRGNDVAQFLRLMGVLHKRSDTVANVQTYGQRSILAYLALRMTADHPALGVGWQGSTEQRNYGPYIADARRRFPDQPPQAFPSPQHFSNISNLYLQSLADLGLVGTALLVLFLVSAFLLSLKAALVSEPAAARAGAIALAWLLVALGAWNAVGLVAGIPLAALTWLAPGLALAVLGREWSDA
jgi:hypothetical protein